MNELRDQVVLITGGNAGIGQWTAIGVAKKGATVVIAGRDAARLAEAAQFIASQSGRSAAVHTLVLDLRSLHSVRTAAAVFLAQWPRLDVLINNAGVYSSTYQTTTEGFELQFGVNHLGHFLLTQLLLPRLLAAPAPRVINVASVAYRGGRLDFRRLRHWPGPYWGLEAYSQSKLCNVLFTRELARRYPSVACNCLHPGVVRTQIAFKNGNFWARLFWHCSGPFMRSVEQGAATSIFLASAPEAGQVTGQYFDEHQRPRGYSIMGKNNILAQQLWTESERYVQEGYRTE